MCPTLMCNFHRNVHVKSFNKIECVGSCVTFNTHGCWGRVLDTVSRCHRTLFRTRPGRVREGGKRACPFTPPEPRFQAVRTARKRGPKYPELVPLNRWDCARGPGVYPGIPKPPSRRFGATWTVWRHPPQDAPKPPLARSPSPAKAVPDGGYF
jgi:hypothetical protein